MITVVDTNVLASGFVRANLQAAPVRVLDAWRTRAYTLVVSQPIVEELASTLQEPYFRRRLSPAHIAANLALLRKQAVAISGVAAHPEDDLVLATAVSARADYLVTGDHQRQQLSTYQGVTILSPRQFLDVLASEATE